MAMQLNLNLERGEYYYELEHSWRSLEASAEMHATHEKCDQSEEIDGIGETFL